MSDSTHSLEGRWIKVFETGQHGDDGNYSRADLDEMVRNHQGASLGLGLDWSGAKSYGQIQDLRRDSGKLMAKLSAVPPKLEELYADGALPKATVTIQKTPQGIQLKRVGLLSGPEYPPHTVQSLDDEHKEWFNKREVRMGEGSLSNQWVEIFRAGDYGDKGKFTANDLDQIAQDFSPSFHEPPVVIGHPKDDAPAYGWVEGLRRSGDKLLAKFKQVDPKLEKMVKSGQFKKRSVALYRTAKGFALRHVGFLGSQPPEVKGLADAVFQDGAAIEFSLENRSAPHEVVAALRNEGLWARTFDRCGFPQLFDALAKNPTTFEFGEGTNRHTKTSVDILADVVAYWAPLVQFRERHHCDPGRDFDLHLEALRIRRERGISYGDALRLASE